MAVKPFLGQVKASTPIGYKVNPKANTVPEADMKIQHVWGVRNQYISDRVRNQVKYNSNENGCFFITAALGVEMNINDKSQTFYQGHE